jgi:type I restriction enzyme S subunit
VCVLQRGFDLPTRLRKKGKYDLVTSSGINDTHVEFKVNGPGVVTGRSGSIGNVFLLKTNFGL